MSISDYDAIFFESLPNPERHIDRLYTQAYLKGLAPCQPHCANVLEIGCSTGANIIPQAVLYPNSKFLGLDLSKEQIAIAQGMASTLALKNVEFVAAGIETLQRAEKSFDYIICHGLYSWVSADTQRMLTEQIAYYLSPNGVAYLSYNTEIGWRSYQLLKDYLVRCAQSNLPSNEKIARARSVIAAANQISRESKLLSQSRAVQFLSYLDTISDALLLHEYLNPHASGVSVTKLHSNLKCYGLQYFGDARPQRECSDDLLESSLRGALTSAKKNMHRAEREDLSDLIQPKSFRAALVVRDQIHEKRVDSSDTLRSLYFASPLIFLSEEDISEDNQTVCWLFMRGEDQPVHVSNQVIAEILTTLARHWPVPVSGQVLFLNDLTDVQHNEFMRLVWSGAIEVSSSNFTCTSLQEEMPTTSPYIRLQAQKSGLVSTLKHEYFQLNDFERSLLKLLDGSRTRADLVEAMRAIIESGQLTIAQDQAADITSDFLAAAVNMALQEFAEHALLMSRVSRKFSVT
jgi:methyltransferase-like protein